MHSGTVSAKNHAKLFIIHQSLSRMLDLSIADVDKKHFTRKRKSLPDGCISHAPAFKIIGKTRLKSLYTTLFKIYQVVIRVTDGAFCKARQKINYCRPIVTSGSFIKNIIYLNNFVILLPCKEVMFNGTSTVKMMISLTKKTAFCLLPDEKEVHHDEFRIPNEIHDWIYRHEPLPEILRYVSDAFHQYKARLSPLLPK